MLTMKNYRSSIPKSARERLLATHLSGPRKFKVECRLSGKVIGIRYYDVSGDLESESPFRNGKLHGRVYFFESGNVSFCEPFSDGLPQGTARQWSEDGQLIGTYTMKHGTGLDLWRAKDDWGTGSVYLSEARYIERGQWHGFEWWLNEDQKRVNSERHFWRDQLHGIERSWNSASRLRRGYPKYWVKGHRVTKQQYISACSKDPTLPAFRLKDNKPKRDFPPEVKKHCAQKSGG
ncbi:MAG TPA: hypothetical protein VF392_10515 [Terracidiphilus sp.]